MRLFSVQWSATACLPQAGTAIALIALMAFALPAQKPPPVSGPVDPGKVTFNAHSELVFLPTRVQKKDGGTIHGLRPEQFVVEDNGIRQAVQVEAAPEESSLSIVVLVQCTRSAAEEFTDMKGLGTMMEGIVGDSRHELAVVSYGERPYVLSGFSGDPAAARFGLSKLRACGDFTVATIDAVEYAIGMLSARPGNYRHAILLIGEKRDHGSRAKLDDVLQELGVSDTVIYSVAFSPVVNRAARSFRSGQRGRGATGGPSTPVFTVPSSPPSTQAASEPVYTDHAPLVELPEQIMPLVDALRQNTASALATLSGGDYFAFSTARGFDESLQRISNQIRNYYLLSFRPPAAATGYHSLRVRVAGHPDAVIQARRSYWLRAPEPTPNTP